MSESEAKTTEYAAAMAADHLDLDGLRNMYALEVSGEPFYQALAAHIGNDEAAVLLRRNGREEAGHARRLARALELKLGAPFEPTPEMLNSAPVALPEPITTEFFELLLKAELGGDVSYATWADNEPDPEVARLYRLNGREESLHAGRVEAVMALLATT